MADYYYKGFGGCESVCDLEIDQKNNIIVFTEKGDNNGTSITNVIEDLANMVVSNFQLDKKAVTCFEIYNAASYKGRDQDGLPNISLVQFECRNGRLTTPRWSFYETGEFVDFLRTVKSPLLEHFNEY